MNHRELSSRVNSSGEIVVSSFESFKQEYQAMNKGGATNDTKNIEQMKKMDNEFESLSSAVNGLKRSMQISRDPRFNRF